MEDHLSWGNAEEWMIKTCQLDKTGVNCRWNWQTDRSNQPPAYPLLGFPHALDHPKHVDGITQSVRHGFWLTQKRKASNSGKRWNPVRSTWKVFYEMTSNTNKAFAKTWPLEHWVNNKNALTATRSERSLFYFQNLFDGLLDIWNQAGDHWTLALRFNWIQEMHILVREGKCWGPWNILSHIYHLNLAKFCEFHVVHHDCKPFL